MQFPLKGLIAHCLGDDLAPYAGRNHALAVSIGYTIELLTVWMTLPPCALRHQGCSFRRAVTSRSGIGLRNPVVC